MSDPKNPFAAWMGQMQDMAKTMNPALEHFTPTGFEKLWPTMPAEMVEQFMGKGLNPEGLDAKTKMLLTLAGLTVLGAQAEAQIRLTVRQAAEQGATKQEIAETIGLMGLFGGLPAMNKAMELANAALGDEE
ncbi:carboxymuconolactone decarboxylase family protein [Jannaschia donghaensis]|uniref:4-carboxymuconolactone decarboxylase n=1 Tax=Jannaschia donghaensis TaxID=420998 RepID=A0A0M6YH18_9RHOB|nr:carboxymuconolactone decarboxylase family protein [Jannaschia donghaensis]CTQ49641.1 4-carboxymuconolactone decarboxylase [Jannaschia donghaensis]